MMSIKVAVVILNWNGEELLPKFLPSVLRYTPNQLGEVVVVDNCSIDSSLKVLEEQFPEVRTIVFDENYGFALGYNNALKKIDAQYYVLLNSDVEVSEGWLQPLVELLDNNEQIAAVQPKIRSYNEPNKFEYGGAAGGFLDKLGYPYCNGRMLNKVEEDRGQYNKLQSVFWASGACLLVRANLFNEMEGFDASFWAHMEEIDLCWRLKNRGYQIYYQPQSIVYHLGGGSLSYDSPRKLYLNFRNNLYMLFKNLPSSWLVFIIFIRLNLDGLAALKLLIEGNVKGVKAVFMAHMMFYRQMPKLIRKRRILQRERKIQWHAEMQLTSILWKSYFGK